MFIPLTFAFVIDMMNVGQSFQEAEGQHRVFFLPYVVLVLVFILNVKGSWIEMVWITGNYCH